MNAEYATALINGLLTQAGETARVSRIEPNRSFRIDIVNGKRVARHSTGYAGLTVELTGRIQNTTRLYHLLDQNINAEPRIAMRRDVVYLYPVTANLPYTAPVPR